MAKYILFQYGFEKDENYISDNIRKLLNATGKEFFFRLEDYAWYATGQEAATLGEKLLRILDAYKAFDYLRPTVLAHENRLRSFMPRCYAAIGNFDKSAAELTMIAKNYTEIIASGDKYSDIPAFGLAQSKSPVLQTIHILPYPDCVIILPLLLKLLNNHH